LKIHDVQIAPRTFYAWRSRGPSKRALWDTTITELLAGIYQPDHTGRRPPESLYGAAKMWAHLQRQGVPVARCTVERLMQAHGWRGVRRDRRTRTTTPAVGVARPGDLVQRRFHAPAPNRLFVADFTYVPITSGGFAYTAFVIDAYAGDIPGWHVARHADATLVSHALADALETRNREGHPVTSAVHHSDAGTQYTSIAFGHHLLDAGIRPSIGSVGDAYDNALAETTIGLYKTECTRTGSPFHTGLRSVADVEAATAAWVYWYRTARLMHRLGRRPPAEAEANYYAQPTDHPAAK
jgi:transposase InsO family protein